MSWTPRFPNMDFGEPIIANLKRIFERDGAEALTWANGGTVLTEFAAILECERVASHFPSLAIFPRGDAPVYGDEEQSVYQSLEVLFEVANISSRPGELALDLMKRVRAVRMIVMSATDADLTEDTMVHRLDVDYGPAVYEQIREHETRKGQYYRAAYCLMTFKILQG